MALPGKNTVDSGDLKNNVVRSQDVRNGALTGQDIRDGRIGTADVRNGTLTGTDVNESSLATVPSAARAGSAGTADTAGNAGSVDGFNVTKINYRGRTGDGSVQVLNQDGLVLTASCPGVLNVDATSTVSNALIHVANGNAFAGPQFAEEDDFDPGSDTVDVVPGDSDNNQGTITYTTPAGRVVTVTFMTETDGAGSLLGGTANCVLSGTAVSG